MPRRPLIVVFCLSLSLLWSSFDQARAHLATGDNTPQDLPELGHTHCTNGFADIYPCNNIDLGSFLPLASIGGGNGNDIWGWTDPTDGREYAIMGRSNGTSFVDVTDPEAPVYLGDLPPYTTDSFWRDIKVYQNYAFIVSEAQGHGLQIFDLTQLRSVASPPASFETTAHYDGFGNAHNIAIDEDTAYAYAVGSNTCAGGLHMVDISDPLSPAFAGCFAADGYTHDTECVVYNGPDLAHDGAEVCFSSNVDTLTIVDVTDKSAPVMLSRTGYAGSAYTHQSWLTDDQTHLLLDDESDELDFGHNTRTYIWDVSDLDAPVLIGSYTANTKATDHNLYLRDGYAFESNYHSGLRILDAANVAQASLSEVAFFDVYPADDDAGYNGSWSVYPFFPSGTVVVSGIEQGLFVLEPQLGLPTQTATATATPPRNGDTDLALGQTASQSSVAFGGSPDRAADGVTDGDWTHGSVSHTNSEPQAWWQVDLGAVQSISSIDVWNRTDCCSNRLSAFYVLVSDVPFTSTDLNATLAQPGVASFFSAGEGGRPTAIVVSRTGRYVRVQLSGTNYLSLAEVQVWGPAAAGTPTPTPTATSTATAPGTPTATATSTATASSLPTETPTTSGGGSVDLALGRAATQSSTAYGGVAARAADGNIDGVWEGSSVTHTSSDLQAWWQVDLGAIAGIGAIDVWNRTDCCSSRLSSFYVLLSDVPFTSTDLSAVLSQPGVSSYFISGTAGRPTAIAANRTGRYVRVQLSGTNYLSLAEVQVWSSVGVSSATPTNTITPVSLSTPTATATPTSGSGTGNLALGKPATQSSTAYGGTAGRAVDGSSNGDYSAGSVSHTGPDAHAWWQVDLGAVQSISSIDVWNRTDCCSSRLGAFYVLVSDAPFASTDLTTTINQSGVSAYYTAGTAATPTVVAVNRTGRYVRVQLSGTNYLSLAEVRVLSGASAAPEQLTTQVLASYPHDTQAFTQGLLLYNGSLYESTGLTGQSSLREVDPTTGQVARQVDLDSTLFGEGLARVGNELVQLTWQNHVALIYDLATFASLGQFSYTTEGWGLCFDGAHLLMSDGSSTLYVRDPQTFAVTGQIPVTNDGAPVVRLNELECVGDSVYANVWLTDNIVRIDKATGHVTAVIDASGLLTPAERSQLSSDAVLNGIAYDPQADVFYVTGKLWPKLFEVRFVPPSP